MLSDITKFFYKFINCSDFPPIILAAGPKSAILLAIYKFLNNILVIYYGENFKNIAPPLLA